MIIEQTIDKLLAMKLDGMAASMREQMQNPQALGLPTQYSTDSSTVPIGSS